MKNLLVRSRILPNAVLMALTLLAGAVTSGCVHRIPIQQGNFLETKDIDRVTIGMTRVQVRALLGTPMISDPFHQTRWDYLYYFRTKKMDRPARTHFVVYFDDQDKVARVERAASSGPADATPAQAEEEAAIQAPQPPLTPGSS
jgi:outer membrane protein assembly factor BamE